MPTVGSGDEIIVGTTSGDSQVVGTAASRATVVTARGPSGPTGPTGPTGATGDHTVRFARGGTLPLMVGSRRAYNDSGRTLVISSVRATVVIAPVGQSLIVDVNKNGTTIFTTQANRPAIPSGELTNKSPAPDVTLWPDGEYLTVDIDQIGSSVAGSDLLVEVTAS